MVSRQTGRPLMRDETGIAGFHIKGLGTWFNGHPEVRAANNRLKFRIAFWQTTDQHGLPADAHQTVAWRKPARCPVRCWQTSLALSVKM